MEEGKDNKRICKRCNRNFSKDLICTHCKIELVNHFDSKLDWQTAYEIEKVQRRTQRYLEDEY